MRGGLQLSSIPETRFGFGPRQTPTDSLVSCGTRLRQKEVSSVACWPGKVLPPRTQEGASPLLQDASHLVIVLGQGWMQCADWPSVSLAELLYKQILFNSPALPQKTNLRSIRQSLAPPRLLWLHGRSGKRTSVNSTFCCVQHLHEYNLGGLTALAHFRQCNITVREGSQHSAFGLQGSRSCRLHRGHPAVISDLEGVSIDHTSSRAANWHQCAITGSRSRSRCTRGPLAAPWACRSFDDLPQLTSLHGPLYG